jgi:hypothetical protein
MKARQSTTGNAPYKHCISSCEPSLGQWHSQVPQNLRGGGNSSGEDVQKHTAMAATGGSLAGFRGGVGRRERNIVTRQRRLVFFRRRQPGLRGDPEGRLPTKHAISAKPISATIIRLDPASSPISTRPSLQSTRSIQQHRIALIVPLIDSIHQVR